MIEELKFLLEQLDNVPEIGLWILAGFVGFKLIVYLSTTGSIVYIAKLFIEKVHHWATSPRPPKLVRFDNELHRACITTDGTLDLMIDNLKRVRGKALGISSSYIHESSARWLQEAIDEKEEREALKESE